MSRMTKVAKALVCILGGAAAGGAGGIGIAVAVMSWVRWRYPDDPSAGSVGIIGMMTVPLGVLIGMMGGAFCADRWMKK
jgi:hypothetical protein